VTSSKRLLSLLGAYDPLDLAAGIGALQLLPENADRLLRLQALADLLLGVVVDTERRADRPRMGPKRWRDLLNGPLVTTSPLPRLEDPFDQPFVEQVTFIGSQLVLPGIAEEAAFIVQHLLKAVLLAAPPFPDRSFGDHTQRLAATLLSLSDAVLRRAGLDRGTPARHPHARQVVLPPKDVFDTLKAAVTFSADEITALLKGAGAADEHLMLFIATGGGTALRTELADLDASPVLMRPLVRVGDTYIVVAPAALSGALRHAIISAAVDRGVVADLAKAYRNAVIDTVEEALSYIDSEPVRLSLSATDGTSLCGRWFTLDNDKLLYVLVVTDPLDGYDRALAYGTWPSNGLAEQLQTHLAKTARAAEARSPSASEFLFLVVTQGVGRQLQLMGRGELAPSGTRAITLRASDLEVIALLERGNRLALRQYAEARDRFRTHTRVVKTGELDEFAFYRSHDHGYYASDGPRPTDVWFQPGLAEPLWQEVHRRYDFHGVRYADTSEYVEVVLIHDDLATPLYMARRPTGRVAVLVERLRVPVWILGPEVLPDRRYLRWYVEFAELVAYWIWQCTADLEAPLEALAHHTDRLLIRLDLRPDQSWLEQRTAEPNQNAERGAAQYIQCRILGRNELAVELQAGVVRAFKGPDNAGERELLHRVLNTLTELLDRYGVAVPDGAGAWVENVVERHAPLGLKKKVVVLSGRTAARVDTIGLPPYRAVQEAEEDRILDEIGDVLDGGIHLPTGPMPKTLRRHLPHCHADHLICGGVRFRLAPSVARYLAAHQPPNQFGWLARQAVPRRPTGLPYLHA
jgi:hypothetical protein